MLYMKYLTKHWAIIVVITPPIALISIMLIFYLIIPSIIFLYGILTASSLKEIKNIQIPEISINGLKIYLLTFFWEVIGFILLAFKK